MAGITSDFMRQALQQALANPAAAGAGVTSSAGATAQPQQPAPDAEVVDPAQHHLLLTNVVFKLREVVRTIGPQCNYAFQCCQC